MNKTKKAILIASAVFLVCILGAGTMVGILYSTGSDLSSFWNIFGGNKFRVEETASLPLDGITALSVDCMSGNIVITDAQEPRVELKGNIIARERKEKYLDVSTQDGKLNVVFDFDAVFPDTFMTDVRMTVYLPKDSGLDLQVTSASGNFNMDGMQLGNATISHTSGETILNGCAGKKLDISTSSGNTGISGADFTDIHVGCQSGNITIKDTNANATVRNTSGSVDLSEVYGTLDINNTSGGITVGLAKTGFKEMNFNVTSGNVTVYLPKEAAFDLLAKATSGNISSDFNISVSGKLSSIAGKDVVGACNGGGEDIHITTISGNINIRQK